MIRLFTYIAKNVRGAVRRKMSEFFTVIADYGVAHIDIMAGLITMTAGAGLAIVTKMN